MFLDGAIHSTSLWHSDAAASRGPPECGLSGPNLDRMSVGRSAVFPYEQLRFFALMRWRCGVKQGLRLFFLQNEIKRDGGTPKTRGFDVHHVYEHSHLLSNVIGST